MTRKLTQQVMHQDHTHWTRDHKSWLDDVRHWERQHEIATQLLHEVQSTMDDFTVALKNHAREIEAHQAQIDEHEKAIAFQKRHGISYTKDNDQQTHGREEEVFVKHKDFHEILNQHNRKVQANVLKLFEAMGGTA